MFSNDHLKIYDTPGITNDYSLASEELLTLIKSADSVFILYSDSIYNCREMIAVVSALNPVALWMVRTKADQWD